MVNAPWLWTGLVNNDFDDALNWLVPLAPGTLSDCEIFLTAPATILAGNETINSLSTSADVTLSIAAHDAFTLIGNPDSIIPTGVSNILGTIALGAGAQLNVDGKFNAAGALNTSIGSDVLVDSGFVNTGVVRQAGDLTLGDAGHAGTVTNAAGGVWGVFGSSSNAEIQLGAVPPGSVFDNAGKFVHLGSASRVGVAMENSGQITDAGGGLLFASGVTNTGSMTVMDGTMTMGAVSGTGTLNIDKSGTLSLMTGSDAGQTVNFHTSSAGVERLDLGHVGLFEAPIVGFSGSDLIDVNTLVTSESFAGGVLTLKDHTLGAGQLQLSGNYTTGSFSLSSDGHSGTLIHFV